MRIDAISTAIDALFDDPHLGWDATWTHGSSQPKAVRVICHRPDDVMAFGETRLHTTTTIVDVRVADVAQPAAGDLVAIDGETCVVQGTPRRDSGRLVWSCEARPA